ncbi:hypothetical protein N5D37_12090 [Comamonas aquatica]|nr:hypothetical protein [Comamonas aquatica]MDH1766371.1 hypothetical protein [Comamonas aquatica]
MYSYADRIRAVELYIKLGLRVRATIRQLGYQRIVVRGQRVCQKAEKKPA